MKTAFKKRYIYIIAFLVPVILLVLVYAFKKVYPFGGNSVLVLDLNAQYVYYYEAFRDALLGDRSLLYSFSRTLGGEMVGTCAYYLASPYSLVLLIFPKTMITEAVLCIILLKVGSASAVFAYYLKKIRSADNLSALLFSIMYGLMSYMVVQTMNPMWLDGLILLPLILLGVRALVDEGRTKMFIISLALLFIAHFYIGYMTGIFVLVYFLYYAVSKVDFGLNKEFFNKSLRFAGAAAVSVLLSVWLLVPTYFSLKMGKLSFTNPDFTPLQKLDLLDFFAKLLPMSYDSVNYHGLPFVFCGTIVLLLGVFYFINKKISLRDKLATAGFIAVMLIAFTVSTLDIVIHGFQAPNWLNYRYSFILSFFLLDLAFVSFSKLRYISHKTMLKVLLVFVLLITLVGRQDYTFIIAEKTLWLSLAAVGIYTLMLYLAKVKPNKKWIIIFITILVSAEMFLNAFSMITGAHDEVYYSDRASYRDYFDKMYPLVDYMKSIDDGFYRSESVDRRTVNDPMALGINGISHSNSALNSDVIAMMHSLGFASQEHWTRYKGSTLLTDAVFGIKYIISSKGMTERYDALFEENELTLYENPYAMPIAFPVNRNITNLELDSIDPFINQNALLSSLLGQPYTEFFKTLNIREVVFENMMDTQMEGFVSYSAINPALNAHIEYILETAGDKEMYMYLYSEYPRKVNIWRNREYVDTFFEYESNCIMPLGTGEGNETLSLITTPIEGEYYLNNNMFYYLDTPLFEEAIKTLVNSSIKIIKRNETNLEITAGIGREGLLFTSIPYDKGWRIEVNGKKTEGIKVLDSLMSIPVDAGDNEISMRFIPYGSLPALGISLVTLSVFIFFVIKKRRRGTAE